MQGRIAFLAEFQQCTKGEKKGRKKKKGEREREGIKYPLRLFQPRLTPRPPSLNPQQVNKKKEKEREGREEGESGDHRKSFFRLLAL